jgi:hypothetical protein
VRSRGDYGHPDDVEDQMLAEELLDSISLAIDAAGDCERSARLGGDEIGRVVVMLEEAQMWAKRAAGKVGR